ncbi:MAG: gliding motility-associated C-terminal domain-containing protein [Bacteroidota bacterium]
MLHKGANPKNIIIEYEGLKSISIQHSNLIIKTSVNQVTELAPIAYQIINGEKISVQCNFRLNKNKLTFEFLDFYDKEYDLIIDPVLIFSTYTGSFADNWGFTATYDEFGNTYSGGICFGNGLNEYPVSPGAFQVNFAGGEGTYLEGCDIAIIKYDPTGQNRIYATYLGGARNDLPHSTIVDQEGNLLIFGTTGSDNFPMTQNPFDSTFNGGTNITYDYVLTFSLGVDMYIAKLSADGTQLLSSTYVGGTSNDGINFFAPLSHNYADGARGEINIDENNNVYVVSTTASVDFPVSAAAFQPVYGGGALDGCVFVIDNGLHNMIWSSFIGGSDLDAVYGVVIDDSSNVYICGGTVSQNFPTTIGVLQPTYNGGTTDGFISKISANGSILLKSTYYGSAYYDQTYLMDRSKQGYIYVYGQTSDPGSTFINNALWNHPGAGQFISKIYPNLDNLVWSTTFGTGNGGPDISPTAFLVDLCDKIYLSGWGGSVNSFGGTSGLPISSDAYQSTTDNSDFYLLVINDNASAMVYGTFFGGPISWEHVDGGTSRFDRKGKIYQSVCAGCGGNDDFPTTPLAWSNVNNSSNCNNGTFKFDFMLPITIADFQLPPVICIPDSVHFINTSYSGGAGMTYFWTFGDGNSSTLQNPIHYYNSSGVYNVTLAVTDTGTCNMSDTISKQVLVLSNSSDTIPTKYMCIGDYIQIGILPTADTNVTFHWIPSTALSDPFICNPISSATISTIYTLLVSNGVCTDTLRQKVVVYDLDAYAGHDTTTCDGHITLTANTAQDANLFHWSTNHDFTDWLNSPHTNPSMNATISTPTYYYVMVNNGYCSAIDSVLVSFVVVADSFHFASPSCQDSCNGWAAVVVSAGNPPYTYHWSNGGITDTIQNLCEGTYSVTVTDNSTCISISSIVLPAPEPLLAFPQIFNIPCDEACVGSIALNTSGGSPPYFYYWNNGQTTSSLTGLCAGNYSVTITDTKLCQESNSFYVIVDSVFGSVVVYADKDTIYQGQSTILHSSTISNCIYTWEPPTGLDNPFSPNPTASPNQTTTYYITIVDNYGCLFQDTLRIVVLDVYCSDPYVYVPNAFTPNGDNKNDELFVRSKMVSDMSFLIYNRWGEKVFETDNIKNGWDGTYNGKPCDPGVFVYYLNVTCHNKTTYLKKGNITIIR